MPETPQELYERAAGALRVPAVQEWDTWPFEGGARPKALLPPEPEPALPGAGGVDCRGCDKPDEECLWTDENWQLHASRYAHGLPLAVLLQPREHFAHPGDLPDPLAREQGVLLTRIERAARSVEGIAMVHVCRWGEGAEHLHWWFIGRPEGFSQLRSSFAAIWDDVLPPLPQDVRDDNHARLVRALEQDGQ